MLSTSKPDFSGLISLVRAIEQSSSVTWLNLSSNALRVHGGIAMGQLIHASTTLTHLDLSSNALLFQGNGSISSTCVSSFAAGLQVTTKSGLGVLHTLDLRGNQMGQSEAECLLVALNLSTNLSSDQNAEPEFQRRNALQVLSGVCLDHTGGNISLNGAAVMEVVLLRQCVGHTFRHLASTFPKTTGTCRVTWPTALKISSGSSVGIGLGLSKARGDRAGVDALCDILGWILPQNPKQLENTSGQGSELHTFKVSLRQCGLGGWHDTVEDKWVATPEHVVSLCKAMSNRLPFTLTSLDLSANAIDLSGKNRGDCNSTPAKYGQQKQSGDVLVSYALVDNILLHNQTAADCHSQHQHHLRELRLAGNFIGCTCVFLPQSCR
jgi:hypothetical protein